MKHVPRSVGLEDYFGPVALVPSVICVSDPEGAPSPRLATIAAMYERYTAPPRRREKDVKRTQSERAQYGDS